VGAPQKWRDYSKVTISRGEYFGNGLRAAQMMYDRNILKIGQRTDKSEWGMTTPTVNAFYNPASNSINFPAGILQTPFFDPRRDKTLNFGGAGAVIGHEMTHGVTNHTSNLDYVGESGGLNESMSDCFGIMISQWVSNQTVDAAHWLIGEGLMTDGKALRSMKDPGQLISTTIKSKTTETTDLTWMSILRLA